jgi:hypothetical protein
MPLLNHCLFFNSIPHSKHLLLLQYSFWVESMIANQRHFSIQKIKLINNSIFLVIFPLRVELNPPKFLFDFLHKRIERNYRVYNN